MRVPGSLPAGSFGRPWPLAPAGRSGAIQGGLLAVLAVSVAGCYDPSKPSEVGPFVITLLVAIFAFIILMTVLSLWLTRSLTRNLMRSVRAGMGVPGGTVPNGLPTLATIESITDTGITMSMPGIGAASPRYRLGLRITPVDGSAEPYLVETTAQIPRIYAPMILPGAVVPVLVDASDRANVALDLTRLGRTR